MEPRDPYRILQLSTGEIIVGTEIRKGKVGIVLEDVVTVYISEDHIVYLRIYLEGLSSTRQFYFPSHHVISIGMVSEKIIKTYINYWESMNKTIEKFELGSYVEDNDNDIVYH